MISGDGSVSSLGVRVLDESCCEMRVVAASRVIFACESLLHESRSRIRVCFEGSLSSSPSLVESSLDECESEGPRTALSVAAWRCCCRNCVIVLCTSRRFARFGGGRCYGDGF